MIPPTIRFTGMNIPADHLLFNNYRIVDAPYPSHFTKIEITVTGLISNIHRSVNDWLIDNIKGQFGSYLVRNTQTVIVFFADDNDAVIYKLMGGNERISAELTGKS